MTAKPFFNPAPKPTKKEKKPRSPLSFGGKKPKEAGRRYELSFSKKYDEPDGPTWPSGKPMIYVRRRPGSGAFVELKGDILADIVKLRIMFEAKSWAQVDGRGEKTVTFPTSLLYKLDEEAKTEDRVPMLIYHVKNDSEEWAVIRYSWLHAKLRDYELQVQSLTEQLEEAMAAA